MVLKLWSPDKHHIIIVTKNLLEMHIFRPYPSLTKSEQAVFNKPARPPGDSDAADF